MIELLLIISSGGMRVSMLVGIRSQQWWRAGVRIGAAGGLGAAVLALTSGDVWEWQSASHLGGEVVHWRLDVVSGLFLALLCLNGGAGAVYGTEREHPRSTRSGRVWWSALVLCLGLVLVTTNGLHFLIAWELFTVAAYFLVTLNRHRNEVRAAGGLYLGASHVAALCLFAFFEVTFPVRANFTSHTPETVLEQIVEPTDGWVMHMSRAARRLQLGRVQSYVLYLLIGLTALAVVVLLRGDQ